MQRPWIILATAILVIPGCTMANPFTPGQSTLAPAGAPVIAPAAEVGSIRIVGGTTDTRRIQYVTSEIMAARITVTNSGSRSIVSSVTFKGDSLAGNLNSSTRVFNFRIDNLPVTNSVGAVSYQVTVDMFLDPGATVAIGSSTSSAFTVSSASTTTVSMPALTLAATAVGNTSASLSVTDTPAPAVVIK